MLVLYLQVGSTPLVAPSASSASSNSGTSTTLVTPIASATGSATAARRSRFGGRSQSVENITALDAAADAAAQNVRGNRFSMFNAGETLLKQRALLLAKDVLD